MTAKSSIRILSLVILTFITFPAISATILPDSTQGTGPATTTDVRGTQLMQRLTEIRDMDKSELTRSEKRDLRKEVKGIRKEMREGSKGIYLSVGAIIIIILLLILIL